MQNRLLGMREKEIKELESDQLARTTLSLKLFLALAKDDDEAEAVIEKL